jgi:hypothetical protein
MADLRSRPTDPARDALRKQSLAAINWPMPKEEDEPLEPELPRTCIELHGAAYVAFCKSWGPAFVPPEDEAE